MEIINSVIQDKKALELIDKLEPKELRDDMKNHLYLILVDYDQDKIKKAHDEGYLHKLVGRIILSQFKSNTSDFWAMYRNNGFRKGISFAQFPENMIEDFENKELRFQWVESKTEEIKDVLRGREYYHKILFDLYFFENKTYQQIEKETGINFQSVRVSVIKTINWLKKRIDYEL